MYATTVCYNSSMICLNANALVYDAAKQKLETYNYLLSPVDLFDGAFRADPACHLYAFLTSLLPDNWLRHQYSEGKVRLLIMIWTKH